METANFAARYGPIRDCGRIPIVGSGTCSSGLPGIIDDEAGYPGLSAAQAQKD